MDRTRVARDVSRHGFLGIGRLGAVSNVSALLLRAIGQNNAALTAEERAAHTTLYLAAMKASGRCATVKERAAAAGAVGGRTSGKNRQKSGVGTVGPTPDSPPTVIQATASALGVTTNAVEKRVRSAARAAGKEAEAVFRRKAIYEEIHPETKHGAASPNKDCNLQSFIASTAQVTGKDKSTVSRAAARGKALGSDLSDITGTSLDKGSELDAQTELRPSLPFLDGPVAGPMITQNSILGRQYCCPFHL
jgi:hypothetical protein